MLRLSEGRFDDAWRDLLATQRLARLLGHRGAMIDSLVAIAFNSIASRAELVFLERAKYDAKQILKCLDELKTLPPLPSVADDVDLFERCFALSTVIKFAHAGVPGLEKLLEIEEGTFAAIERDPKKEKSDPEMVELLRDIDWDSILREVNKECDRSVSALREPSREKREKLLRDHESAAQELKKGLPKGKETAKMLLRLKSDPAAMNKLIRNVVTGPLESAQKVQQAVDRAEQIQRNLLVAFALGAYQREHGSYPKTLNVLAPKYLAEVPTDYFTGKPLIYRPTDKGYLLYSFGQNGKDDGGQGIEDDPKGDDLAVRMPLLRC